MQSYASSAIADRVERQYNRIADDAFRRHAAHILPLSSHNHYAKLLSFHHL